MNRIFTMSFWVQLFLSTLLTMCMIYLIKKMFTAVNVPVVSNIVSEV